MNNQVVVSKTELDQAMASIEQFDHIFQTLELQREQHVILAKALMHVRDVLTKLNDSQTWAERYQNQIQELKAQLITTALDDPSLEKNISL